MAEIDRFAIGAMPLSFYLNQTDRPLEEAAAATVSPLVGAPQKPQKQSRQQAEPKAAIDAAEAFRTRCREVINQSWCWGRSRQALRMLLAAPSVSDATLRACLRAAPVDHAADASALALPTASDGDKAVVEETRRIASIVNATEAVGREQMALELALGGVPLAQALTLLSGMPRMPKIPSIAERAAAEVEIGPEAREANWGKTASVDAIWERTLDNLNRGAADA